MKELSDQKLYRQKAVEKSRLAELLGLVKGKLVCARDSEILREEIGKVDDPINHIYFDLERARDLRKRITKQAKFFRDHGNYGYLINGKFHNLEDVKALAEDIFDKGKKYFGRGSRKFLNEMAKQPKSSTPSVKQVRYIETLKNNLDERILPHMRGEIFDRSVYQANGKQSGILENLMKFAINGNMKESVPRDGIEVIGAKWYDPDLGLEPLRMALFKHIQRGRLKVKMEDYEPFLKDLETFYSKQEESSVPVRGLDSLPEGYNFSI